MNIKIDIGADRFDCVISHLLPRRARKEQAAFLFASCALALRTMLLSVIQVRLIAAREYASQSDNYLELSDEGRAQVIKEAHDLSACIIEMHSHPSFWPAEFSATDRIGLLETVPHMKWRLPQRPYAAIVVARGSFDALIWLSDQDNPTFLDSIVVGGKVMRPTNLSIRNWQ